MIVTITAAISVVGHGVARIGPAPFEAGQVSLETAEVDFEEPGRRRFVLPIAHDRLLSSSSCDEFDCCRCVRPLRCYSAPCRSWPVRFFRLGQPFLAPSASPANRSAAGSAPSGTRRAGSACWPSISHAGEARQQLAAVAEFSEHDLAASRPSAGMIRSRRRRQRQRRAMSAMMFSATTGPACVRPPPSWRWARS